MLQLTLGVVWLGPLRHGLVIAGSSVVNAAPATFADADGNKNRSVAATAANVVRPASGRRPGLRFILVSPSPSCDRPYGPAAVHSSFGGRPRPRLRHPGRSHLGSFPNSKTSSSGRPLTLGRAA